MKKQTVTVTFDINATVASAIELCAQSAAVENGWKAWMETKVIPYFGAKAFKGPKEGYNGNRLNADKYKNKVVPAERWKAEAARIGLSVPHTKELHCFMLALKDKAPDALQRAQRAYFTREATEGAKAKATKAKAKAKAKPGKAGDKDSDKPLEQIAGASPKVLRTHLASLIPAFDFLMNARGAKKLSVEQIEVAKDLVLEACETLSKIAK